jgi:hypothetical protein
MTLVRKPAPSTTRDPHGHRGVWVAGIPDERDRNRVSILSLFVTVSFLKVRVRARKTRAARVGASNRDGSRAAHVGCREDYLLVPVEQQ